GISEKLPCLNSQQAKSPQAAPPAQAAVVIVAWPRGRGLFDARVDRQVIVAKTREPFLSACRVLLQRGWDPNRVAVMRHACSSTIALKAPIGVAAGLTVEEGSGERIRLRRWRPPPSGGLNAPVEFESDPLGEYRPTRKIASLRLAS